MPPPDHRAAATNPHVAATNPSAGSTNPRGVRLLGWFLAANAVAALTALLGPGTGGAAHHLALWCGIG